MFYWKLFSVISVALLICNPVSSFECGKSKLATGLVHGGFKSKADQWPFAVSLHLEDMNRFFSGGVLVSPELVLTGKL